MGKESFLTQVKRVLSFNHKDEETPKREIELVSEVGTTVHAKEPIGTSDRIAELTNQQTASVHTKDSNDPKEVVHQLVPISKEQIMEYYVDIEDKEALKKVLADRYPSKFISTTKRMFDKQIAYSQTHFDKAVASYFASLVVFGNIQLPNGQPFMVQDFSKYTTIQDMFHLVTLIDSSESNLSDEIKATHEYLTLEGVLQFFVETYLEQQLTVVLTDNSQGRSLLSSRLTHEETLSLEIQDEAIAYIVSQIDKVFFISHRAKLVSSLRNRHAENFFRSGEMDARAMSSSHDKYLEQQEEEAKDFLEEITRTNNLWVEVQIAFEKKYKMKLPKEPIDERLYNKRLVKILNTFKKQEVPVEHIRELSHLTTKFKPEVLRSILSFDYS